jgi:hypothetical protein
VSVSNEQGIPASIVIGLQDETPEGLRKSSEAIRDWANTVKEETRGATDEATRNNQTWQQSIHDVSRMLKGFGALQVAREIRQLATDVYDATLGMGEFIVAADKAGVTMNEKTRREGHELAEEAAKLTKEIKACVIEMAGPFLTTLIDVAKGAKDLAHELAPTAGFIGDIGSYALRAADSLTGFSQSVNLVKEKYRELKGFAEDQGEKAARADQYGWKPVQAGARLAGRETEAQNRMDARDVAFSEKDFDNADAFDEKERMREVQREAEKSAREAANWAKHLAAKEAQQIEKETQQVNHWIRDDLQEENRHVEKEAREIEKKAQQKLKEQEHAREVLESTARTEAEKLAAVDLWQQKERALVGSNQAAIERIEREGAARRLAIIRAERMTRISMEMETMSALHGIAVNAGMKSHAAEKAFAIAQAWMSYHLARIKMMGQLGIHGFAAQAPLLGLIGSVIGALKGSSPVGDAGGGGTAVGFSPTPTDLGTGQPANQGPLAPIANTQPQNTIQLALTFMGSLMTQDTINKGVQDYLEMAGDDGRTRVVVRQ